MPITSNDITEAAEFLVEGGYNPLSAYSTVIQVVNAAERCIYREIGFALEGKNVEHKSADRFVSDHLPTLVSRELLSRDDSSSSSKVRDELLRRLEGPLVAIVSKEAQRRVDLLSPFLRKVDPDAATLTGWKLDAPAIEGE